MEIDLKKINKSSLGFDLFNDQGAYHYDNFCVQLLSSSPMRSACAWSDGVIVTYRITVSSLARVLRR